MKNILILFGILVLASCSKEDDIFKLDEVELSGQESRSIVAKLEHDLNAADPTTAVKFTKSELTIIDNQYYLVASNDTYTSTTLLRKGKDNQLVSAGISCTSKACASSSTACVPKPDGKSCTTCLTGDCTKTVTDLEEAP
jgi:hypothetical protein